MFKMFKKVEIKKVVTYKDGEEIFTSIVRKNEFSNFMMSLDLVGAEVLTIKEIKE